MTRSRPDSAMPSSSMKTAASSGSSSPSSISILRRQGVDQRVAMRRSRPRSAATSSGASARSPSPTLSSTRTGFWVRNRKPRIAFSSSASSSRSRIGVPGLEPGVDPPQDDLLALGRLALGRGAVPAARLEPLEPTLGHRQVGQQELEVEPLEVARRDRRCRRDAGSAGSSNARTTWSSASESRSRARWSAGSSSVPMWPSDRRRRRRQVDVRDVGLDDLLGLEDLGEPVEAVVGDLHDADVEGDAAVAAGLGVAAGERVEDGRLARAGKPDDGDLHPASLRPIEPRVRSVGHVGPTDPVSSRRSGRRR